MNHTQKRATRSLSALILVVFSLALSAIAEQPAPTLKFGSKGDAVLALQRRLCELGYLHDRLDGIFGRRVQRSVNAFQKQLGLRMTGAASPELIERLLDPDTEPVSVYIAPTGKRYHARKNCRGLSGAKSIEVMRFTEAEQIRTPCIICYGRYALRVAEEKREAQRAATETDAPAA